MSNASTNEQDNDNQKGLFEDFSFSTVIASGLAAATSFLLSAKIGLAGSIIGVAIGGVASAAASQIYKSLLQASADKLSDLAGGDDEGEGQAGVGGAADGVTGGEKGVAGADPAADLTQVMGGGETSVYPVSVSAAYPVEQVAETGTPIAPTAVRAAAHAKQRRDVRRRATIIAAACAVAAVLIFSLVVTIATKGAGIGGGAAEVTNDQPAVSEGEGTQQSEAPKHEAPAGRGESDDAEKSDESHVTATTGQDSQGTSDAATQGSTSTDTTSTTGSTGSQGTSSSTGTGSSTGTSSGTGSGSTSSSNTTSGGSSSSSSGSTSNTGSGDTSSSKSDTSNTSGGSSSSSGSSSSTGSSSTSGSSTSTTSGTNN